MATLLLIGAQERSAIHQLRELAARHPVDMRSLPERLTKPEEKKRHKRQMTQQTIFIPFGFFVTYSIEIGHPGGMARHLSVSSVAPGRIPSPQAVQLLCKEFGFKEQLDACQIWIEELDRGGDRRASAVNVAQIDSVDPDVSGRA